MLYFTRQYKDTIQKEIDNFDVVLFQIIGVHVCQKLSI